MSRAFVLHSGNVESTFEAVKKLTEGMARHAGLLIDTELYWSMHPASAVAIKEAKRLNARRKLRWWDRRTRGWKHYEAERQAFFKRYEQR